MRKFYLIAFALLFTLGGLCARQPDTPPGQEEEQPDTAGSADQPESTSVSSPTEEGQKTKVCEFKNNHIASIGALSGSYITLEGKKTSEGEEMSVKIPELIELGFFEAFGVGDFSKKQFVPAEGGGFILSYEYTGEDYSDWCPSEGECVVEVVYKGVSEESIFKKGRTHGNRLRGGYFYTGNLTVQILFAGQALDFSDCN